MAGNAEIEVNITLKPMTDEVITLIRVNIPCI